MSLIPVLKVRSIPDRLTGRPAALGFISMRVVVRILVWWRVEGPRLDSDVRVLESVSLLGDLTGI